MSSKPARQARAFGVIGALLVSLWGCSTERSAGDLISPDDVGVIVVDATLIVGNLLPPVIVRRTVTPETPYNDESARVHGAIVTLSAEATASDSAFSIQYPEQDPGEYWGGPRPVVSPDRDYHLRVEVPDGRVVTASTHTPQSLQIDGWLLLDESSLAVRDTLISFDTGLPPDSIYRRNTLTYQDGLLEARFQRVRCAGYQVGLKSLDEDSPLVIDADFLSDEDIANLTRDPVSPPFEAANGTVRLPWFAIFFEGRYRVRIFAVDRNWYDLIRTLPALGGDNSGFGGNAGDRFEKPTFHVEGGIGLFGSASMGEIGFNIEPRPEGAPAP